MVGGAANERRRHVEEAGGGGWEEAEEWQEAEEAERRRRKAAAAGAHSVPGPGDGGACQAHAAHTGHAAARRLQHELLGGGLEACLRRRRVTPTLPAGLVAGIAASRRSSDPRSAGGRGRPSRRPLLRIRAARRPQPRPQPPLQSRALGGRVIGPRAPLRPRDQLRPARLAAALDEPGSRTDQPAARGRAAAVQRLAMLRGRPGRTSPASSAEESVGVSWIGCGIGAASKLFPPDACCGGLPSTAFAFVDAAEFDTIPERVADVLVARAERLRALLGGCCHERRKRLKRKNCFPCRS